MADSTVTRVYAQQRALKYGCNPHQIPAAICSIDGASLPFTVLNGNPGFINLLDAMNAWQLVLELRAALGLPAATSFKHVSPAGAAVAAPLSPVLEQVYQTQGKPLPPQALAYVRARQADPMSSFGDFAAVSDTVDVATAEVLRTEVSDGIIAPAYEAKALEILRQKKGGNYLVLQGDPDYHPPAVEYKEVFGVAFLQKRNDTPLGRQHLEKVVTRHKTVPAEAQRDLLLGAITLKYTQSNSVGYALDGQMIGVGAGQQSRVDCTKLAGRKADIWYLRQHPKVLGLPFREDVKRVDRTNARVRFIEGDMTPQELKSWETLFTEPPAPLTPEEKQAWMAQLDGVSLASDAFFPFRDSIDQASRRGVKYIIQPGGSVADQQVTAACDEYGMAMIHSGVRLFHH
jgi:phosphoribosylaminoimidazolecarboxamide formyltransferase/IMP cyclohydrolase